MTFNPFDTAVTLARKVRSGAIRSEDLLDRYLDRLKKHNGTVNAVIVLDEETARRDAQEADRAVGKGKPLGPLHGVPMTIKESFNLTGKPTTFGFTHFRDNIASADAVAVTRLKQAGAVVFGKTNVPPALADGQSANDIYGRTNNPWNLERSPGGSSGGSAAALAAGLTGLELGSDIASSLRNPAHYCGVYAHKPTYGICSSKGQSLRERHASGDISVIGPMARSAHDLELTFRIIADAYSEPSPGMFRRPRECDVTSFAGLKIGAVLNDDYAEVDQSISNQIATLAEFLRKEGADVRVGWRPNLDSERVHNVYELLMRAEIAKDLAPDQLEALRLEAADPNRPKSELRETVLKGSLMSHREWLHLNEERHAMCSQWRQFFEECDILLCPVLSSTAFPHDTRPPAWRSLMVNGREIPFARQLFWAGYTGAFFLPSTAVPIGMSDDGLPIGIQIVGDQLDDIKCMRFAQLLEQRYRAFVPPPAYADGFAFAGAI